MPREYYVYPNGNQIPISGACEYATQLPMSAGNSTSVYDAIGTKADNDALKTKANYEVDWVIGATSSTTADLTVTFKSNYALNIKSIVVSMPSSVSYSSCSIAVNNVTYTISLGETLTQGGTFDFISGKLTRTDTSTKQLEATSIIAVVGTNTVIAYGINEVTVEYYKSFADYVQKDGDTMTGQLNFSDTAFANIVVPSRSLSYINPSGNAGIHGLKSYNTNSWYPVVCQDTKGGGHWQIGNYDNENLVLVYGTKTNRDGNVNTTQRFALSPWADNNDHSATLAHSGNVGTGDSNGQVKIAGTNVSVKGLGSAAYLNADESATASTVVKRNANKYVYATYYNSAINAENINSYTSYVVFKDSNHWFRCTTLANFKTWFGTANAATKASIVGNYSSGATSGNLRFHAQTSVLSASGTGVLLVTAASLNTIFGVSNCGAGNTAVFVSNGDGNAWGGHFDGCSFISTGTPGWHATMASSVTGTVRINWLAVYFG